MIYYCPIVFLSMSLVQVGNILWGFEIGGYLVILAVAATLFLLDTPQLTWPLIIVAILVACIGSFSSLPGLFIWPAGAILLYLRRRSNNQMWAWVGSALIAIGLYFYHFNFGLSYSNHGYALKHPLSSLHFFLFALGNTSGAQVRAFGLYSLFIHPSPGIADAWVVLIGVILFVVAIFVVVKYGRREATSPSAPAVALTVYGLLSRGHNHIWKGQLRLYRSTGRSLPVHDF